MVSFATSATLNVRDLLDGHVDLQLESIDRHIFALAVILVVGFASGLIPGRKAASLDPVIASVAE